MYANILLCYDGSRDGRRALLEGARLAKICSARVTLLAVVDSSHGLAIGEAASAGTIEHQRSDLEHILAEGAQRLTAMGLSAAARLEVGDPVEIIAAEAKGMNADLVVVGHHHYSRFARWLTRSVANELADRLDCSLLLAHGIEPAIEEQEWSGGAGDGHKA